MLKQTSPLRFGLLFSILMTALALAPPASASTTVNYQATYVEPYGGPQQTPFSCDPGTTCGSASISRIRPLGGPGRRLQRLRGGLSHPHRDLPRRFDPGAANRRPARPIRVHLTGQLRQPRLQQRRAARQPELPRHHRDRHRWDRHVRRRHRRWNRDRQGRRRCGDRQDSRHDHPSVKEDDRPASPLSAKTASDAKIHLEWVGLGVRAFQDAWSRVTW